MRSPLRRRPVHRLAVAVAVAAGFLTTLPAAPSHAAAPAVRVFTPVAPPFGLASGPDGSVWGKSPGDDSVVQITPDGVSRQFTAGIPPGSDHTGITAGPDGNLWFVENGDNRVVKQPTDGTAATEFPIPTAFSGPTAIAAGADGNLWFTETSANAIGRVTTAGAFQEYPLATPGSDPADITAGPDGNLWFTQPGANSIGRITPAGDLTEFTFFRDGASPGAITAGADGKLWFSEGGFARVGRIDPESGQATDFPVSSLPGPITAGPDGNVWFTLANRSIGRITPDGVVTEFPTGLPAPTAFSDLRTGPDGNLWASTDTGKLVRITTGATPPRFSDPARILVPGTGDSGVADPYPATIEADGLQGTVTKVTVRLNGVHHGFASDIHAQLVGPQGQSAVLMANATDRIGDPGPLAQPDVLDGDVLTFSDGAAPLPRRPASGVFAPLDPGFLLAFTPPAPPNVPAPPASLSVFNGTDPNGTWKLFLVDDDAHSETTRPTTGVLAGGWSLDIRTSGPAPVQLPAPAPIVVPGPPAPAAAADTVRPALKLGKLPSRLKLSAFRKGVRIRVTPSEPVTVDTTLFASPRTVLDRTTKLRRAQTLVLKPNAKLLGRPAGTFRVRLRFVVTDGAGNRTTVQRTITVTP